MSELQFNLPLGNTAKKPDVASGFDVGYRETKLRHGADI